MKRPDCPIGTICIYFIKNEINGKVYVGKTKCLRTRYNHYKSAFKKPANNYINDYLTASMHKHRIKNFSMSILQKCEIYECANLELSWMKKLRSCESDFGYNLRMDSSTSMIVHEHTRAKIRKNITAQWAAGIRDSHGKKLAASWASDPERKKAQAGVMTRALTKYKYEVVFPDGSVEVLTYAELRSKKLHNVMANFHREKSSVSKIKGHIVTRIKL